MATVIEDCDGDSVELDEREGWEPADVVSVVRCVLRGESYGTPVYLTRKQSKELRKALKNAERAATARLP